MIMTVHDSLSSALKQHLHAPNYVMAAKSSFKNRYTQREEGCYAICTTTFFIVNALDRCSGSAIAR
jgi:hypothetical protein